MHADMYAEEEDESDLHVTWAHGARTDEARTDVHADISAEEEESQDWVDNFIRILNYHYICAIHT